MRPTVHLCIQPLSSAALLRVVPDLATLLSDTVNRGASLGFVPPLRSDDCRAYWESLCTEIDTGRRILLGAFHGDRIVGSGQLALPPQPNAVHRAEVQRLFVDAALQGQGVGRSLMAALHGTARRHGRSLVLLNTRPGGRAQRFYEDLGYREAGVIPGYVLGSGRNRLDSAVMYQEIGDSSARDVSMSG